MSTEKLRTNVQTLSKKVKRLEEDCKLHEQYRLELGDQILEDQKLLAECQEWIQAQPVTKRDLLERLDVRLEDWCPKCKRPKAYHELEKTFGSDASDFIKIVPTRVAQDEEKAG